MPPRRVPQIKSIKQLADLLGISEGQLRHYVFHADKQYKQFRIAKRAAQGYRTICAPSRELKGIQRWIGVFILSKAKPHAAATAFRKGLSIVDNAKRHVGKRFVLNLDLRDFFPSITTRRVVGLFKSLGYVPAVSFALARIATFRGALPQGAPSSPAIANLVCRRLDLRLQAVCEERHFSYSRYCDDITISGKWLSGHGLKRIMEELEGSGFVVNTKKRRIARKSRSQRVTGLVVNTRVGLSRHKRKAIRAIFHQAGLSPEAFRDRVSELSGYVGWLNMVGHAGASLARYRETLARVKALAVVPRELLI